jgi:hypothetical protein
MPARDILRRPLNADGQPIANLGSPRERGGATHTDNQAVPLPAAGAGRPGQSLLAAPADHVHPSTLRVVASGITTLAPGARVTLAKVLRGPGELFPACGFVYVRDDKDGITWESEVTGANDVATYHERTKKQNEVLFRAVNASKKPRTIEWALVVLRLPDSGEE